MTPSAHQQPSTRSTSVWQFVTACATFLAATLCVINMPAITRATPLSDVFIVIRSNGNSLTKPPLEIQENAGQVGNGCVLQDECIASVMFTTPIENAALDAWWTANKNGQGDATAVVWLTEPVPGFPGDPEAPKTVSDEVQVEVHKNPNQFVVTVKLLSDPTSTFPANLNPASPQVVEPGGQVDVKNKLPAAVAALFTAISVVSDGIVVTSSGNTITFDSATSSLTFANDFVDASVFSGDPIVGAAVDLSPFTLLPLTLPTSPILFTSNNGVLTLHNGPDVYLRGHVNTLSYDPIENLFTGQISNLALAGVDPTSPFYDPSLANINSPFLQALNGILDPSSPDFDPAAIPIIQYQPNLDFFAQTNAFTASGASPITNFVETAIPESPSIVLLGSGLALCIYSVYRKRRHTLSDASRSNV